MKLGINISNFLHNIKMLCKKCYVMLCKNAIYCDVEPTHIE